MSISKKCHNIIIIQIIPFLSNRPFRTGFSASAHSYVSKIVSKILTKWKQSQTFGQMQQTQCKKE